MDDTTNAGPVSDGEGGSEDLAEPEGVNAASREVADEHGARGGDVTSGGSPARAEQAEQQVADEHRPEELAGTVGAQDESPGQALSVGEG